MGYRQYLYSVDTRLIDEIRKCKTKGVYGMVKEYKM